MATLNDRPFSKDYSGLVNQSVIAVCIAALCITSHELMKRKRRGNEPETHDGWVLLNIVRISGGLTCGIFSLYQGRSWAKYPSPLIPQGWPLSWVRQALSIPETKINELRGLDATVYSLFLRACNDSVSQRSMTRASISSLVGNTEGRGLLWIHIVLLFYVTLSWIATLVWICRGADSTCLGTCCPLLRKREKTRSTILIPFPNTLLKVFQYLMMIAQIVASAAHNHGHEHSEHDTNKVPVITRVVIARKMTELATLLERREEMLQKLEIAHVKLAQKTLYAVKKELDRREGRHIPVKGSSFFRRSAA
ncbi:hypothetical protein EDB89DRAFT_1901360, partial [Lactarius sanguifluus]